MKSRPETGRNYMIVMKWLAPDIMGKSTATDQEVREAWLYVGQHWRDYGSSLEWRQLMDDNRERIQALIAATEQPA